MKFDSVGMGASAAAAASGFFSGQPDSASANAIANVHRQLVIATLLDKVGGIVRRRRTARPSRRACVKSVDTREDDAMIRKLTNGQYRLYSRKPDPKTGKRRNLGTFDSRAAAEKHEREVQYFKRAK